MTGLPFEHAEAWFEKLTLPSTELTAGEREEIIRHVAVCPDCSALLADYAVLERLNRLAETPAVPEAPTVLPERLQRLWRPAPLPSRPSQPTDPRMTPEVDVREVMREVKRLRLQRPNPIPEEDRG